MQIPLIVSNTKTNRDFSVDSESSRTLYVSFAVQVSDWQCRLSRGANTRGDDAR